MGEYCWNGSYRTVRWMSAAGTVNAVVEDETTWRHKPGDTILIFTAVKT
jgi:hypothetical protein